MLLSKQWRHRSILLKILNLSSLSRVPICQQFPCAPWTQLLSIFADVSCEWDLPDIWKDFQFFFSESSCHLLSTLNQDASTGTLHPLKLSIQPAAVLHQCFISSLVFRTFFKSFVNLCILWILHIVTGDLRILLVGTYNCLATNDDTLQIAALPWKDDWEWQSQCSAELWREYSSFIHEWEDK